MPVFDSYTEDDFADFMAAELSDVASLLGWTALSHFQHAINRTLRSYGVDTIEEAEDAAKLEALGMIQAWSAACKALSARYDFETDGFRADREALHKHAMEQLAQARADAIAAGYLSSFTVAGGPVSNEAVW